MARGEYFTFKSLGEIRERVSTLGLSGSIGFADDVSPAAHPVMAGPFRHGNMEFSNRFAIHPMEGWDAENDGTPSENTLRRWERMAESGAAMLWGLEAMAVAEEYRANPRQVLIDGRTAGALEGALKRVRAAHARAFGGALKLFVGAQLTASGRYSGGRPPGTPLARVYDHPELDRRAAKDAAAPLMTDGQIEDTAGRIGKAAGLAREIGFDFADIKACHRYWLNETLAAKSRPGPFGGPFENRVKALFIALDSARRGAGVDFPLGVRLSGYDGVPFEEDPATRREGLKGRGRPSPYTLPYIWGWGVREDDTMSPDTAEPVRLAKMLAERDVAFLNVTVGSPYSNPHLSRPTETPPVDGYQPHRDPLFEVAIHFDVTRAIKRAVPGMLVVGTGYSYLRQWKAHAAEYNMKSGGVDLAGVGRAVLAYHDEVKCLLESGEAVPGRGRIVCTGDSACTTGPRLGLVSGCIYDPHYAKVNTEIRERLKGLGLGRK